MLHCNITLDGITRKGQEQFGDKTATQSTAALTNQHITLARRIAVGQKHKPNKHLTACTARTCPTGLTKKNNGDVFPNIPVIVIAF